MDSRQEVPWQVWAILIAGILLMYATWFIPDPKGGASTVSMTIDPMAAFR